MFQANKKINQQWRSVVAVQLQVSCNSVKNNALCLCLTMARVPRRRDSHSLHSVIGLSYYLSICIQYYSFTSTLEVLPSPLLSFVRHESEGSSTATWSNERPQIVAKTAPMIDSQHHHSSRLLPCTTCRAIVHKAPNLVYKYQPSMQKTSCLIHRRYKSINSHKGNKHKYIIAAEATSSCCVYKQKLSSCVRTPIHRYSPTQPCRNPARSSRLLGSSTPNGLLPGRSIQSL
jgi:hypothetical protein